jgi:hypothetical protein
MELPLSSVVVPWVVALEAPCIRGAMMVMRRSVAWSTSPFCPRRISAFALAP